MAVKNDENLTFKVGADTAEAAKAFSELEKQISAVNATLKINADQLAESAKMMSQISAALGSATAPISDFGKKSEGAAEGVKEVGKAAKNSKKEMGHFDTAVQGTKDKFREFAENAAKAAAAYLSFKAVVGSVQAYAHAQDELTKLGNVLRFTGDNVGDTVKDFDNFATSLERTTGENGDMILSLLKSAKVMGLSNDAAKEWVQNAVNMAAATDMDVTTSFEALKNSLHGNVRGFGVLRGLVAGLTDEQLRAGGASKVMTKELQNFAKNAAPTYSRELNKAKEAAGEFAEIVGNVILGTFNMDKAGGGLAETIFEINDSIKANIDSWIALGKGIKWVVTTIGNIVLANIGALLTYLTFAAEKISGLMNWLVESVGLSSDALRNFSDGAAELNAGFAEFTKQSAMAPFEDVKEKVEEAGKAVDSMSGKLNIAAANFEELQTAGIKALDELIKKRGEYELAAKQAGQTEMEQARLKAVADLQQINDLETAIRKGKQWNKEAVQASQSVRASIVSAFAGGQTAAIQKELEAIQKTNDDMQAQAEQYGMNTKQRLQYELDMQLKLIEAQRERLKLEGKYSEATSDALDKQAELAKTVNAQKMAAAPSPIVEAMQGLPAMAGLSQITAFVDAAQALIDLIPALLDKIANLFNSLTELPNKIVEGFTKVFDSVLKFVSDFVPNLISAIPKLFDKAIDFVKRLPQVFSDLLKKLPDLLLGLFDKLPELVKTLVKEWIKGAAKMGADLLKAMIKNGPQLAKELAFLLAIELPRAIAQGILEAFQDIFSGNFNLADMFDTQGITDTFKKIGTALTGEASRLFAVTDFGAGVEGPAKQALQIAEQVSKSFKDSVDLLTKAWRWIYDMIIQPMINGLLNIWRFVWDNFLSPILSGLRDLWQWVYNTVISPLIEGVKSAWQWVYNTIVQPLLSGLKSAGETLSNVLAPLVDVGKKIVDSVKGAFDGDNGFIKKLEDSFYGIGSKLVEGIKAGVSSLGDSIKKALGLAEGGIVPGVAAVSGDSYKNDTVMAMLSPGEAVIPRSKMADPAVADAVRSILSGNTPRFAGGMMPVMSGGSTTQNVSLGGLTINTTQPIDADFVRAKLMPTINKELRRASLDGKTVIYKAGIR